MFANFDKKLQKAFEFEFHCSFSVECSVKVHNDDTIVLHIEDIYFKMLLKFCFEEKSHETLETIENALSKDAKQFQHLTQTAKFHILTEEDFIYFWLYKLLEIII